jgi:hypothetical protein
MKPTLRRSLIVSAAFACIAFAARINTDYDHSADFTHYKTYSWMKVQAGDSLWQDRITSAVDSELAAKGWTKVESGADASIAAVRTTHDQKTLETFYTGMGGGWRWRGFGDGIATTSVDVTKVGQLVVDVFDAQTKKLIWRASFDDSLSNNSDKNDKKLQKDVSEMFKHFPPEPHAQ